MSNIPRPVILSHTKGDLLPDILQVIEAAGRTCYKSHDKITADSAEKLVKALIFRGHESVIEHSWLVFVFDKASFDPKYLKEYFLNVFLCNNLLILTESDERFILSGNARMFRDYFRKTKRFTEEDIFMLSELKKHVKIVFDDLSLPTTESFAKGISLCPSIEYTKEEQMKHFWVMVRIIASRSCTHQIVRHRRCAFSQESQRYCDESGFFNKGYYIVPPTIEESNIAGDFKNKLKQIDGWYLETRDILLQSGKKMVNEDARFLLPNAVASEIVMSCNLEEWHWFLKMRCDSHAQWDIREIAMEILFKFKQMFPGCFDDFIIDSTNMSAKLEP
ncbi:MAG: FAD-dependent thymidylate synthase [Patescibacteria group bacterium]|jgi:thymidylate synthase (FAD)